MLRRVPTVLAPALVVLALASGCGGSDDDGGPTDPVEGSAGAPADADATSPAEAMSTEVSSVAPTLESYYRGGDYPRSVDDVVATLTGAGVTLAPGTEVGGYTYDADAVEFVLCLQDADGAWASYDTAPMGVRDSGDAGGCPQG